MIVYMMVGLPGSGKSTWLSNYIQANYIQYGGPCTPYCVMNIDGLRERFQAQMREIVGSGYVYDRGNPRIENFIRFHFSEHVVEQAILNQTDLFLDNTNLNDDTRALDVSLMKQFADAHEIPIDFRCVFFDIPPEICWERIQESRGEKDINNIPRKAFDLLVKILKVPTAKEGYSSIETIKIG